jgi:hypothetical protein
MDSFANQRLSQTNDMTNNNTVISPRAVIEHLLIQNDQAVKTRFGKQSVKNFTDLVLSFGGQDSVNCEVTEFGLAELKAQLKTVNLKTFEFEVPRNPMLSPLALKEIADLISSQFYLESMTIHIDTIQPSCEEGFAALENAFKSLTSLEKLILSMTVNNEESDVFSRANAESLKNALSQLEQLKHLELNFENSKAITDNFIGEVLIGIKSLSKLHHVDLKFGGIGILTNKTAGVIGKHIGDFKQVKILNLELQMNDNITTPGVKSLIKGLKNLKKLREIILNLAGLIIEDQALNFMRAELNELKKLTAFRINLDYCKELGLIGYLALRELMVNYGELKKIDFSLKKTMLTPQAFAGLCGAVIVFEDLEELRLNLSSCMYMTEKTLKIMLDALVFLKKLKVFRLNLSQWDHISDLGLVSIMEGLINMRHIQHFELAIQGCNKITNYGMRMFRDFLYSFNRLKEINLDISDCREIMAEGLGYLTEGIIALKGLKIFMFSASNCPHLGENLLIRLKEILHFCNMIEYLELEVDGLGKMTDKELNYLKEGILALEKLNVLKLVIDDTWAVMLKAEKFKTGVAKVHVNAAVEVISKPSQNVQ